MSEQERTRYDIAYAYIQSDITDRMVMGTVIWDNEGNPVSAVMIPDDRFAVATQWFTALNPGVDRFEFFCRDWFDYASKETKQRWEHMLTTTANAMSMFTRDGLRPLSLAVGQDPHEWNSRYMAKHYAIDQPEQDTTP